MFEATEMPLVFYDKADEPEDHDLPRVLHFCRVSAPLSSCSGAGIACQRQFVIMGMVTAWTSSVKKGKIAELAPSQTSVSDSQTSVSP